MSVTTAERRYTPEEYLALERAAETKSEYFDGRILPMGRVTYEHIVITGNVGLALHTQLKGTEYRVYISQMRTKVGDTGLYTYPDVVAAREDRRFEDSDNDVLLNPSLIVEVLVPHSEAWDRGEKFAQYRKLESLTDYVLVASESLRVEHYARQGEQWLLTALDSLEGALHLPSLGCRVALRDIYDDTPFAQDAGSV
ncbi:MAG TPA: Uma2 family endonuclease [Armatimonadota bacterium]|nr:Uma2 family endonuclease [Armatimonadota bacterium]